MANGLLQLGIRPTDHNRLVELKQGLNQAALWALVGYLALATVYYLAGLAALSLFTAALGGGVLLSLVVHIAVGSASAFGLSLSVLLCVGPALLTLLGGGFAATGGVLVWSVMAPVVAHYFLTGQSGWVCWGVATLGSGLALVLSEAAPQLALLAGAPPAGALLQPSYVLVLNLVGSATALFVFFHVLMKGYATTRQEVLVKSAEIIGAYDDLNTQKEALKQNLEEMQAQQEELRRVEAHLRASQQQMQELNATLEHRVEERTRELKAAMDNLKNTQAKMVESEKMATLGNLVAGVAHEINTPVGIAVTAASHLQHSIQNFAETVNGGQIRKSDIARVVSEGTEASDIILKNLERASELVQSFKKVAVNQSTECVEEFHLRQYTDEIITSLRPTLRKTKLEVVNSLPDVVLLGLPSAFSQIIINFVTNSIRYAYDEGAPGTLRLWAEVDNDRVHIHYNDDGKGIPPENLPKIFDPFFTTGRTRGGSGLGLNIVYNLVTQKMEGDIRVESTVGQGTTFHLSLPLRLATTT